MGKITNDWLEVVERECKKEYYKNLYIFLKKEYENGIIYPDYRDIFNAFHLTERKAVKVVILGQDPYHGKGQAMGLSFSVKEGIPIPPSLKNIFQELKTELGLYIPNHGNLEKWARQGVLLLNTVLTVREGLAFSHAGKGWEIFTDAIIKELNEDDSPKVYLLWGRASIQKKGMLTNKNHLVLTSPHPSPLSAHRGFFGNGHFRLANEFLLKKGLSAIDWQIENI